jgi:hypothetical protein
MPDHLLELLGVTKPAPPPQPMKTIMMNPDQVDALVEALEAFYGDQKEYINSGDFFLDYTERDDRENKAELLIGVAEVCDLLNAPYLASQLNELAAEAGAEDDEPELIRGSLAWKAAKYDHDHDQEAD